MSLKPVWTTWENPVSYNKTTKGKVERYIQFLDFGILNHPGIPVSDPATLISLLLFVSSCVSLHTLYIYRAPCLMLKTAV